MRRLTVLLLAGALLAACGGGSGRLSKSQYQQHLQSDGNALKPAITALGNTTGITTFAQFATKADAAEAAVKKAADDLASIKPPADAEADNAKIVAALRAIDTGLERLKKLAATGNATRLRSAASALTTSAPIKGAEQAIADLKLKGYNVGFIGTG